MTIRCTGSRWFLGALLTCLLSVTCGGCGDNGNDHSIITTLAVRQTNLIADGAEPAAVIDPNLVNAWGLVAGPTTPWWIADNGTGRSTLYNVSTGTIPSIGTVPGAGGQQGTPTGIVFNGGTGFVLSGGSTPARFIFASEDGTISGFRGGTVTILAVDNSASGAVYKGLAIDSPTAGTLLYATNFRTGTVDVFDSHFNPVHLPGAFTDPALPGGYAPFGIQNVDGTLYVTYAKQDDQKHDDVSGAGNGFVDVFNTNGSLIRRFASRGPLNSPWGLVRTPAGFGSLGNTILVGNFGDGHIHAFDPASGIFVGQLTDGNTPITIDGLWALSFGNGGNAGDVNTLFFTAGPNDEMHGLFGMLQPVAGSM